MTRSSPARAKRLLEPTWLSHPVYVETLGPVVADVAAAAGFAPDPEQELILDLVFAIGPDGKSVAFETGIIGPRQNFKTGTIKQIELGWLFVTEEPLIVHSAHELDTAEAAFNDLRDLIESTPDLAAKLDPSIGRIDSRGVTSGNGKWSIFIIDSHGRQLHMKYKARTATGGRGLTGNKIVLDEAFAVTRGMVGSLYPTLSAVPDPQVVLASSAGLLGSEVLRDLRKRGRGGTDPRLAWIEYADKQQGGCKEVGCTHARPPQNPPGCALDDEHRWRKFMPALGRRITVGTIQAMRRSMPPEEFAREFMVWWEDPPNEAGGAIDLGQWLERLNPQAPMPQSATVVLDVAPDRKKASIGIGADGTSGRTLIMATTKSGHGWVVPALKELRERRNIVEVALAPQSQAAVLIPDLIAEGIEWHNLTTDAIGQSCAWMLTSIELDHLEHVGQPHLDAAIANATTRRRGEVELWDRRDLKIDITALVAAAAAGHRWSLLGDYDVMDSIG